MSGRLRRLGAQFQLFRLAGLAIAGHWVWLLIFLPLLWLAARALETLISPSGGFDPVNAQVGLMGIPMAILAVILGLRIIAGEMDGRSLEIAYTVPGGCQRVWWAKLAASALILVAAEALLALVTYFLFTKFPFGRPLRRLAGRGVLPGPVHGFRDPVPQRSRRRHGHRRRARVRPPDSRQQRRACIALLEPAGRAELGSGGDPRR